MTRRITLYWQLLKLVVPLFREVGGPREHAVVAEINRIHAELGHNR